MLMVNVGYELIGKIQYSIRVDKRAVAVGRETRFADGNVSNDFVSVNREG